MTPAAGEAVKLLRGSIQGYNTKMDMNRLLKVLSACLGKA
jgi:hypothetical protein